MSGLSRDDILRMARESGLSKPWDQEPVEWKTLERFAALVAAAEREECAKICEEPWQGHPYDIAKQIRARGNDAA
jgi:hypothetical protein